MGQFQRRGVHLWRVEGLPLDVQQIEQVVGRIIGFQARQNSGDFGQEVGWLDELERAKDRLFKNLQSQVWMVFLHPVRKTGTT